MLNVFSIFPAISGEVGASPQGTPSIFIRLAGCSLSCSYCDAKASQDPKNGQMMTAEQIIHRIDGFGKFRHLVITGGEPLLQWENEEMGALFALIEEKNWRVTVETNGHHPCPDHQYLCNPTWVVDFKLPGSGMLSKMPNPKDMALYSKWPFGTRIKMVCTDMTDFKYACTVIDWLSIYNLHLRFAIGATDFALLGKIAQNILDYNMLNVVVNCQIHKVIFPQGEKGDSFLKETIH